MYKVDIKLGYKQKACRSMDNTEYRVKLKVRQFR
jgi:hypothetical protein